LTYSTTPQNKGPSIIFIQDFRQGIGCLALNTYLKAGNCLYISGQNGAELGGHLNMTISHSL